MTRYDGTERPVPVLDVLHPYAGPCGLCGFGDKRHRLADAVIGGYRAGDSIGLIMEQYAVTPEAITTLDEYAEVSRRRRHRWEVRA